MLTWTTFAVGFVLAFILFIVYRTLVVPAVAFSRAEPVDLVRPHAVDVVAAVADALVSEGNSVKVLTDGRNFYDAELEAIRQARSSIHIEVYIFWAGRIADEFIDVLTERARAGVRVHLLADAYGTMMLAIRRRRLRTLRAAGCSVAFYHGLTLKLLDKINIRTHRNIMVVDGRIGFVGGAGIADVWRYPKRRKRPWRDMMIRVEGPGALALQGIFIENWLEARGEALIGDSNFPETGRVGPTRVLVINSSSRGRSSHTQILHRLLLISARKSIWIVTPYFFPDAGLRQEIAAASRRGLDVRILTTGPHTDLPFVRAGGRRTYGQLLESGVQIYEYAPGMFHVKMLVIDGLWAVAGTTNFDTRSFMINDEVNIAIADEAFCGRLAEDVVRDIAHSRKVTMERWKSRPLSERIWEQLSRVMERQQ